MKILEIMPTLSSCGVTRFVVDLCNELVKQHEVTLAVFFSRKLFNAYADELDPQIQVVELNKRMGIDLALPFKLYSLLRKEKADAVHIHTGRALQYCILPILMTGGRNYFYMVHSEATFETSNRFTRLLDYYTLFRSNRCTPVANAQFVADSWIAAYGMQPAMIPMGRKLNPNQLNDEQACRETNALRKNSETVIFLCVGNICEVKNQLELSKAVDGLAKEGHDVELVLIGSETEPEYVEKIRELGSPHVHLFGKRNNVLGYMAQADYLCISSLTESGPLVLLEGFFAGTIPLCTPCGDVPNKVTDGVNGLIADSSDECDITKMLHRAISLSESDCAKMQHNAKQSFKLYDISESAKQYATLFSCKK